MIFNIDFDIRNVWIIMFIVIIFVLFIYIYLERVSRRKKIKHIRFNSNYIQTEPVTIIEYDMYGQPYINGYHVNIQPWNFI